MRMSVDGGPYFRLRIVILFAITPNAALGVIDHLLSSVKRKTFPSISSRSPTLMSQATSPL